jgi:hypothetical protein
VSKIQNFQLEAYVPARFWKLLPSPLKKVSSASASADTHRLASSSAHYNAPVEPKKKRERRKGHQLIPKK